MATNKPAKVRLPKRVKTALDSVDAEVRQVFSGILPKARKVEVRGVVRALRVFGRAKLSSSQRRVLGRLLKEALSEAMRSIRIRPESLGVGNLDELAELFLAMVERTGYHRFGSAALRKTRARQGLRSNFAGELFERLVLHDRELADDIAGLADAHRQDFNAAIESASELLVNGKGKKVTVPTRFRGNALATDLLTIVDGVPIPLKYVDNARVSFSGKGSDLRIAILVETEAKIRGRKADFDEQIDAARPRLARATSLRLTVDGETITFKSEDVVFHTGIAGRVAVTSTRARTNRYTVRQSRDNAYLRVGKTIDASEVHRLSGILFNVSDRFVDLRRGP